MAIPGGRRITGRRAQGLRAPSLDLITKASDDTAAQVSRIGLTFAGTVAFSLLSLLSPDSALLGGSEKLNVPGAGPVSFFGFMLLGPAVLIVLRIYLQIYVEHGDRLDRIARRLPLGRAPTLVPLKNPLLRGFNGVAFYLLLPLAILLFAWKAAAFPVWGSGLLCVAIAVIISHATLSLRRFSWRFRVLLSLTGAILVGGLIFGSGIGLRRPFHLFRANLAGEWLIYTDLRGADLFRANLSGAVLRGADLRGADLFGANLSGADLRRANLSEASLSDANLSGADLSGANLGHAYLAALGQVGDLLGGANLRNANLSSADLSGATLSGADLSGADLSGASLRGARVGSLPSNGMLLAQSSANLKNANLKDTDLHGANLNDTNLGDAKELTQAQLDEACGISVKLPGTLSLKPCPKD